MFQREAVGEAQQLRGRANARAAATELSRARVERAELDNFLGDLARRRTTGKRPA